MSPPMRIVVADDEPDMRKYFQKCLTRLGHQVVAVARNGCELVEQCRAFYPDLVITDVRMPEMDGLEAAAEINRERPVPVILVSAYPSPEVAGHPAAEHVLAHLVKPIRHADLEAVLRLALQRLGEFEALRQKT